MDSLRFLHIPKTAGSTFTSILKHQYAGERWFAFTGDAESDAGNFEALPDHDRNRKRLRWANQLASVAFKLRKQVVASVRSGKGA